MPSKANKTGQNPLWRYVAPFVVFGVLTECQRFGTNQTIFWIYAVKTVATAACLVVFFRGHWKEIEGGWDTKAVLLGLGVFVIWIFPDLISERRHAVSFNPQVFESRILAVTAVFFRVTGAALVVPLMEELLWRSFLMRWLVKKDFLSVPLGTYTPVSFFGTVFAFMLVHQMWEWPVAVITGMLYGGYLVKTRNLWGCILAHAVTNFALAVFVLSTGRWYYW